MRKNSGSVAVYIILMSVSIFIVLTALLQQTAAVFTNNQERYYYQLAEEAAEAGSVYAEACLGANSYHQTWGADYYGGGGADRPNLIPSSDCEGTAGAYSSNQYVYQDSDVQTRFSVGQLSSNSLNGSAIVSVIGYTEVLSGGTVVDTYQFGIKKNINWDFTATADDSSNGIGRTCAIIDDSVYCWGTNTYGQLGNNSTSDSETPQPVIRESYPGGVGNKKATKIVSAGYFNCVLIETGEVYCWGQNDRGQLGQGDFVSSTIPLRVQGDLAGKTVTHLGVARASVCARVTTGDLYCWGDGNSGQLGNGSSGSSNTATLPVLIAGPSTTGGGGDIGTTPVSTLMGSGAYSEHMCAIASELLYCWGENGDGELGLGDQNDRSIPTIVDGGGLAGKNVLSVAGDGSTGNDAAISDGDAHTCAVAYTSASSDAKVYCWGAHTFGQTGSASTDYTARILSPLAVNTSGDLSASATVSSVAVTATASCVTAYTGNNVTNTRAYCWGSRDEVGAGPSVPSRNPEPLLVDDDNGVLSNNRVSGLRASSNHACVSALGRLHCWGLNINGELGDTTAVSPRTSPVESLYLKTGVDRYTY